MIIIAFKVMIKLFFSVKTFFALKRPNMNEQHWKAAMLQKSSFEIYYIDIISSAIASASKSR
jgi:hypothetical protein